MGRAAADGSRAQSVQFFAFTAVTFFIAMGVGLIIPILPEYKRIFALSSAEAGLIPAAFFAGRLAFDLVGGVLSDRLGARKVLYAGCVLTGAASVVAGVTSSFPLFLAALLAQGMGAGLFVTAAMAIIIALIPPGRVGKALGTYQSFSLLGFSIGPAVGGFSAAAFGPRGPFFVYAVVAFGGLVCAVAALRMPGPAALGRSSPEQAADWSVRSSLSLLRMPALMLAMLGSATLAWTSGGIRGSAVPLFANSELGFDAVDIGLLMSASSLGQLAVIKPGGALIDRIGRRPVIVWSMGATAASIALLAVATEVWALVVVAVLFGVALGCLGIGPWSVLVDVVEPRLRGTAAGVQRAAVDLGKVVGPVAVGALIDLAGYRTAFLVSAVAVAACTLVLVRWLPETRPSPESVPPAGTAPAVPAGETDGTAPAEHRDRPPVVGPAAE
jgi:MFS transporter, DHA1 family, multidrug resistance protein